MEQRNPRELADALERMLIDSNLREHAVVGAYENVKRIFDLDRNVAEMEKLISESI